MVNMDDPRAMSSLVRAASKLSVEELALVTGGTEEDAGTIISVRTKTFSRIGRINISYFDYDLQKITI